MDTTKKGFTTLIPFLRDELIQNKLQKLIEAQEGDDVTQLVKTTADLTQFIFSSPKDQKSTKKVSETLCKDFAKEWTDQKNIQEFSDLISKLVQLTKEFNNRLQDVRHTDRHTIPMAKPDFIKFISNINGQLVELFILSLPKKFFVFADPDLLKEGYLKQYQINEDTGWFIPSPPSRIEDIPF